MVKILFCRGRPLLNRLSRLVRLTGLSAAGWGYLAHLIDGLDTSWASTADTHFKFEYDPYVSKQNLITVLNNVLMTAYPQL